MNRSLAQISLLVRDYDEAIAFYVGTLGFDLVEDTPLPVEGKRWVVVRPKGGAGGAAIVLARASNEHQQRHVGDQAGGRVFLFLHTDDFSRDYQALRAKGVEVVREPQTAAYGTVAVFRDLYGNLWDLVQPAGSDQTA